MNQKTFEKVMLEQTNAKLTDQQVTNNCLLIMCRIFHDIERQLNLMNMNNKANKKPEEVVGYDGGGML